MNIKDIKAIIEQLVTNFKGLPTYRKIIVAGVLALVVAMFAVIFLRDNEVEYQVLYSNLSLEDAGNITAKLKEQRVSYELARSGSSVMVPTEKVYELRLALANEGLPAGGHVGFEIFDKTKFSTSEFVQKLNYQRALQGELARTITEFREVEHARVLLVMPKESLFVEDSKSPSASVLLKLRSGLASDKVGGVVHLVASAVEGLEPEQVTVVDTAGNVLFKGSNQADRVALFASSKLDHQRQVEAKIAGRIQSMLEGIVGKDKAIVRVSADIDFDQVDFSEEKYDPDSSVIRSRQHKFESSEKGVANASKAGVANPDQSAAPVERADARTRSQKEDEVVNYEINRFTRHVTRAMGAVRQLSVAAVVDGTYEIVMVEDGSKTKKYIPRSEKELEGFEEIVKRAMGFDEDREDKVYVSSFPFSISPVSVEAAEGPGTGLVAFGHQHLKTIINFLLVILIILFIVRPILKWIKGAGAPVEKPERLYAREDLEKVFISDEDKGVAAKERVMREKTMRLAKENVERTEQLVRGWLHEEN
ncbi:MAG: flagellar M-ring protein FliF [Desulfobacterales bacterium]|nr:flagellar M-ring protein FliF [Desulfobacterales bacterium]